MLNAIPTDTEIEQLLSPKIYAAWESIVDFIKQNYSMDILWDIGRKAGKYECKFRKGGKTLCALYARENSFGVMVILGKNEREKFEEHKASFSAKMQQLYDNTHQYHDGKWLMVDVTDATNLTEIQQLIVIKKKPRSKP